MTRTCLTPLAAAVLCAFFIARPGHAGQGAGGTPSQSQPLANLSAAIDGSPPPVPPDVATRDAAGRVTARAVRLTTPLRLDGRLDEEIYASVLPISDFIQSEPVEGTPATERTELWVFFDDEHMYVGGRCWESHPENITANELRRDGRGISGNDSFSFSFDTFYDRRSLVYFQITPLGGWIDGQVTNGTEVNTDWNPVWDVTVRRFEGGWVVEAAVPFKSLRYSTGTPQVWGFNARRTHKWKNEISFLSPVPAAIGNAGLIRPSVSGTLVGVEVPSGSLNLELKPYAIAGLASEATVSPPISNDPSGDAGLDVKFGVTKNVTADLTVNTDFAQVEADEQQVNLTRFSLLFPEKREFFLENAGTFSFGGAATSGRFVGASDTPALFYSRRIGLSEGREVPIVAGGRLTGRVGRFDLGLLNIQTGDEPVSGRAANFSVVRVKRDLLRRSYVGVLITRRSLDLSGRGANAAYGLDGTFRPSDTFGVTSYWARTRTDELTRDDTSYRAALDYAGDRYGVQLEHLLVGDHFNPEVGFVRRDDIRKSFALFRFSPRPLSIPSVRKFSWTASLAYIENVARRLDTRDWNGEFAIEFENSDRFSVGYTGSYELVPRPFEIARGVMIPTGGYDFASVQAGFTFGPQRAVSGGVSAERGTFYSGHKTAFTLSSVRAKFTPHLSAEPNYSFNLVDLVEGSFTTHLLGARLIYGVTARMFGSALLQYSSVSRAVTANVRFRWEYQPGSELFLVFNEQRDSSARGFPALANRAFIIKITRLFR